VWNDGREETGRMSVSPDTRMKQTLRPETPVAVVNAYLDAMEARDFDLARKYLSDTGFHYRSPVTETCSADNFTLIISRIGPILERIRRCKVFTKGDEVCVIMHIITTMEHLKDVPVVQVCRVVDGKIIDMEVFFDASEYNRMFDIDP
jgi:hypothetical protein